MLEKKDEASDFFNFAGEISWNDFELTAENEMNFKSLTQCLKKREIYQNLLHPVNNQQNSAIKYTDYKYDDSGVFSLLSNRKYIIFCPSIVEFHDDCEFILNIANDRATRSLCHRRLQSLKHNFMMYKNLCSEREKLEQKRESIKDFYTVTKVDTHIHHSASMNSKHLLNFMKKKFKNAPDEIVYSENGQLFTLREIFAKLNIRKENLCIDSLDTHAHTDTFLRFDRFNTKYSPYGRPLLRNVFLKYDNYNHGKYLFELTSELFQAYAESKYVFAEYRISIYGKDRKEWSTLANWVVSNNLRSKHVKWLIQIPRIFSTIAESGQVYSFGDMIKNIFEPLFQVILDPTSDPTLFKFLTDVVGFDCVDDESLREKKYSKKFPNPTKWIRKDNPPYSYYIYYIYANITTLNHLCLSKGLKIFRFRPHCGETGEWDHLVYGFLAASSISHGVQLRKSATMRYLYYVSRIGLAMSPLSNNSLFISIEKNPFPDFFKEGLNVSLSTDDPLQFHFTKEPLMEEYSVASQIWKLNSADQCELARNSVLQSNFSHKTKVKWLGENYEAPFSNNIKFTNIPNLRVRFRQMMYEQELWLIKTCGKSVRAKSIEKFIDRGMPQ